MVEAGTLCINANVVYMAGTSVSGTITDSDHTNVYIKMIEGWICDACRYDFVTNYASQSTIGKEMLRTCAAAGAAFLAVNADQKAYGDKYVAQSTMSLLWNVYTNTLNMLRTERHRQFIKSGTP